MANRGNLYWEISFTALYHGAADCTDTGRPEWGAEYGKQYFVITWEA